MGGFSTFSCVFYVKVRKDTELNNFLMLIP